MGTKIEAISPGGAVAGCYVVDTPGVYGLMSLFGADDSVQPAIPGFTAAQPVKLRVNGIVAPGDPAWMWSNDLSPHQADIDVTLWTLRLPVVMR